MSVLQIHRTTTDTELDKILVPGSEGGDEFTAPPGTVILMAVNKNKDKDRLGRHIAANDRIVAFRVEHDGIADEMSQVLRAGDTYTFGPFGVKFFGPDGPELGTFEPVTVKLTYPNADGLKVCAVSVEDMRAKYEDLQP